MRRYRAREDPVLLEEIVKRFEPLARSVARRYHARGEPLPCAVVVGCPPIVSYTSGYKMPDNLDEVSVAMGLLHDVVEDTLVDLDTIRRRHGPGGVRAPVRRDRLVDEVHLRAWGQGGERVAPADPLQAVRPRSQRPGRRCGGPDAGAQGPARGTQRSRRPGGRRAGRTPGQRCGAAHLVSIAVGATPVPITAPPEVALEEVTNGYVP